MKQEVKIACLQMNSSADIDSNLEFVERYAHQAAQDKVDVLQLPENFAQMAGVQSEQHAESAQCGEPSANTKIQQFLSELSCQLQISIIAGSVPIYPGVHSNSPRRPYARCLAFGPDGGLVAHYDKIHLFDVDVDESQRYRESDSYSSGAADSSNFVIADLGGARIGLSICYDLRFAELFRQLNIMGAQILSVPSAFTFDTGKAHWETLLRARAIENQAFVFAAAQTGKHASGRETWGHSMIIDPWGGILAGLDREVGLISTKIDLSELDRLRTRFPISTHRRLSG